MHFFYLDESGDTGTNLDEQPIFVLGGISVSDERWKTLEDSFCNIMRKFLGDDWNDKFELHSEDMRNRHNIWEKYDFKQINDLTLQILNLIVMNGHKIHFFAINKGVMKITKCTFDYPYEKNPYFLAYEYILNYVNVYIKNVLGKTARGIFIIDEKQNNNSENIYYKTIREITDKCRYGIANSKRLKRIVEFTYPIDSKKNRMIQISDLVVYCIRKYFEYKLNIISRNDKAKEFYTQCFNLIYKKTIWRKTYLGCDMCYRTEKRPLNTYLKSIGILK